MPIRPQRPCKKAGCTQYTRNRNSYCDGCEPDVATNWAKHQEKNGSRHERGYGKYWVKVLRPQAIEANRKRFGAIYFESPEKFIVESFPNMEGEPLQGFCEEAFAQGIVRIGTHVDHKVAKRDGGTDDLKNLQVLNFKAHQRKTGQERRGRHGAG